jgi:hypothetical protein
MLECLKLSTLFYVNYAACSIKILESLLVQLQILLDKKYASLSMDEKNLKNSILYFSRQMIISLCI